MSEPDVATLELRKLRIWWAVVAIAWLLLSGLTITTSSMGAFGVGADSDVAGVIAGTPKTIRGDEFARGTPLMLGVEETGDTDFVTPLTNETFITTGIPSTNVVEIVIFPERALLRLGPSLPDGVAFAFVFWFSVVCTLLFLPYVLMAWGARFLYALAATLLVVLSPSVAWWSWVPLFALAPGLVASSALILGTRYSGRWTWWVRVPLALLAGIGLARLPWTYMPWSLPLSGSVFGVTLVMLVFTREKFRAALSLAAIAAGTALAMTVLVLVTNADAFTALSETVYPGSRRTTGTAMDLAFTFGAPFLGVLQQQPTLVSFNYSELSSTWNIAVIVWVIAAAQAWSRLDRAGRAHVVTVGVILAVGYSWVLIDWPPKLGAAIPGLNLIDPHRMTAIIGMVAIMSTAMLISFMRARIWAAVCGAIVVTVILAAAGTELARDVIPSMTTLNVVIPIIVVAAIVVLVLSPHPRLVSVGLVIAIIGGAAIVYQVGPIQRGLGALRNGEAAGVVRAEASADGTVDPYWVSDNLKFGSLLAANGVPAISGDAWTGPSELWSVLDPSGQYELAWNRAASRVQFTWDSSLAAPEVTSPQPDMVVVSVSPCDPVLKELRVGHVVANGELTDSCLIPVGVTEWSGQDAYLYELP